MKLSIGILAVTVVLSGMAGAQATKTGIVTSAVPVYLSHEGNDKVGMQFIADLRRELSKSNRLKDTTADLTGRGLRFYVEISTLDVGTVSRDQSVASVVIEEMGVPNSYPVASKWYHKVILLEPNKLSGLAGEFVLDMDAHWCRTIKNSLGGCPKEFLAPILED